jgi:Phosphate-selective porin O and P
MALLSRQTFAVMGLIAAGVAAPLAAQNPSPISVGGVVYAQWAAQMDSLSPANNFDITRAYINVIGRFNGGIMTRITGDIYRDGDATAAGALLYRLKYAYAAWTPEGSPLTLRFGLTQTPWVDWEEALWDYRMEGTIAVDRNGYMSSSDFGVAVDGNFNHDAFNFQAMADNGENYNKTPGDSHKDFAARASVRLLATDDGGRVGGLRISGYAQAGTPTGGGSRNRYLGMVSYRSKMLTLAAEYVSTKDTLTTTANSLKKGSVISAFGVLHLGASPAAIIARLDVADPNTCTNYGAAANCPASAQFDKRTTIIGGVSYQLSPQVRLLADIDRTSYQTPTGAAAPKSISLAQFQTQFTF